MSNTHNGRRVLHAVSAPTIIVPKKRLYLAFGSNLHMESMKRRCPDAEPIERVMLDNARLVFRWVADVALEPGSMAPAGLWKISARDEQELDRYEGVGLGRYDKWEVQLEGGKTAFFYKMGNEKGIYPPDACYESKIRRGYRNFGINESFLDEALCYAQENQKMSEQIKDRKRRYQGTERERMVKIPERVLMKWIDKSRKEKK